MTTDTDPLLDELRQLFTRFADRLGDDIDHKEAATRFGYAAHLIALDTDESE